MKQSRFCRESSTSSLPGTCIYTRYDKMVKICLQFEINIYTGIFSLFKVIKLTTHSNVYAKVDHETIPYVGTIAKQWSALGIHLAVCGQVKLCKWITLTCILTNVLCSRSENRKWNKLTLWKNELTQLYTCNFVWHVLLCVWFPVNKYFCVKSLFWLIENLQSVWELIKLQHTYMSLFVTWWRVHCPSKRFTFTNIYDLFYLLSVLICVQITS